MWDVTLYPLVDRCDSYRDNSGLTGYPSIIDCTFHGSVFMLQGMVITVDLDEKRILQCVGDEMSILPQRLRRCLKVALQLVTNTTQPWDASRNVLVSEAFVRMFVEVCGHYRNHIVTQQDSTKIFEVRESSGLDFIKKFGMTHDVMFVVLLQFLNGNCCVEATHTYCHLLNPMVVCHCLAAGPSPLPLL
jgi:hypothetical protein